MHVVELETGKVRGLLGRVMRGEGLISPGRYGSHEGRIMYETQPEQALEVSGRGAES